MKANQKNKPNPILIVLAVMLVAALGPFSVIILVPAIIIYALVKGSPAKKSGTPSQRYLEQHPQRKQRFDDRDPEQNIFEHSEGGEHRDNPFQAVQEKMSHRFGKPQPHEFGSHVHVVNDDHSRARRLEQLEVLKGAGLYTEKEYRDRKAQILRETE